MSKLQPCSSARADEASVQTPSIKYPLCLFTKPFNSLSFEELGQRVAELGFQGIEAPVRPGGHIEPEQVTDRLPALKKALASSGIEITILTSNINDVSDPTNQRVLQTAADLGIRQFRMQYFKYDRKADVLGQLDGWKKQTEKLAAFCGKVGIQALYQNHAGPDYMGAPLWDLQRLISDIDPAELGVAYDIRHAVVEGGTSWRNTWRMLQPHIAAVYVKDFAWQGRSVNNVPLGEGNVPEAFFKDLRKSNFAGPISLHEEYLDHRRPELVPTHLAAIKSDLKTLKSWLTS